MREGDRILPTSKEVGLAYGSVRSLGCFACREKRAQRSGTAGIPVPDDLQEPCARVDSASVFTCLRIALRISPEKGLTRLQ
jgi:hypothetical protein